MQIHLKYNIIWKEIVDSTSIELKKSLDKYEAGTVIAALEQICGRGQGDHKWHSTAGHNLTFSVLLKYDGYTDFKAADQMLLTMASSLAVVDFLSLHSIDARIKKPNDIYVEDKKICGMLIENGLNSGLMKWSIAGIGINVNETDFPSDVPNPTSMSMLTGKHYDIKECLEQFISYFNKRTGQIWSDSSLLRAEYESLLRQPQ